MTAIVRAVADSGASLVLLVGTDHLSDWDGENGRPDILSPERQSEVADLVDRLLSFSPTKVALEVLASRQSDLARRYGGIERAGQSRSEVTQIGFRLAQAAKASVHAVDADWTLDHAPVEQYFDEHPGERFTEDLSPPAHLVALEMDRARKQMTLSAYLRFLNETPAVELNDREYLDRWLPVAAGSTWAGVDLVASWYRRNLRIFANLQQIAEPGDRIVMIFGSGHVPSLRHLLDVSGRFEYVSPLTYL